MKQVSESTRIKERLLKAIEEDRYELLSSPVYVKGFLDAYARYLHLDRNEIVLRYQEYYGDNGDKIVPKEPEFKQRLKARSNLRRWIIVPKKRGRLWLFIGSISTGIFFAGISLYYIFIKPAQ